MSKWKDIKVLALDIDGVMTRGELLALPDGTLLRIYNAKDTFALRMATMKGLRVVLITGARGEAVVRRFSGLGVKEEDMFLNSRDKAADFRKFCKANYIDPSQVAYIGDDLPDIPLLKLVGKSIAPADAVPEVQESVEYLTDANGGEGCVRWVVEKILKAKGLWSFDGHKYEEAFGVCDSSPDSAANG